jgi:hypothetical protein
MKRVIALFVFAGLLATLSVACDTGKGTPSKPSTPPGKAPTDKPGGEKPKTP